MIKGFLGFIVGVVATGLVLMLFEQEPEQTPAQDFVPNEAPADPVLLEATRNERSRNNVPENAEVSTTVEPAESIQNTIAEETASASALPILPIVLPPEFDWLSSDPSFQSLQNEPIDPAWSIETEAQINRYFAERPEITSKYGFPTVHCRTTRCQVLIAGYGIDEASLVAEFGNSLDSSFADQPWAEQFELGSLSTNSQNDVTTLRWVLSNTEGER